MVDLRYERGYPLSAPLLAGLGAVVENGGKAILLLNRRGVAPALHCRAWALLFNFRPWHPGTARANSGWRCPAERLNQHRYHDDWLQNLLVSASLAGYRRRSSPPHNP